MKLLLLNIVLIVFVVLQNCNAQMEYNNLNKSDKQFLDTLQYKTFLYFINELNPENGLVKDRSTEKSPASMAATGFAIPVWCIGAENNWISRKKSAKLTLALLEFLMQSEQSTNTLATGYHGFYYHFVDMKTGKRFWNCELSSIDTGLLLAGIRFAFQYFNHEDPEENEIRTLCNKLTERVNWKFMTIPDTAKLYPGTISLWWDPEGGLGNTGWVGYNEALILQVIAAGTGYEKAKDSYEQWLKYYEWRKPYEKLEHIIFPPLFGHQYSHMFIDFRGIRDSYCSQRGLDYFENSKRAVLTQRMYCIENPKGWKGYDSLSWGLTACDGPGSKYSYGDKTFFEYEARGTSGKDKTPIDDGTIAPTASAASICFAPEIVMPTLRNLYEKYGQKGLWGKYGFKDSFNPTLNWYDADYLGIDEGPIVIMIENYKNGFVWKYLMNDEVIKKGLGVLGYQKVN